jgi:LPXTG-motif cell wall-anchored protein
VETVVVTVKENKGSVLGGLLILGVGGIVFMKRKQIIKFLKEKL